MPGEPNSIAFADDRLDPVAEEILRQLGERGPGKSLGLVELAQAFAEKVARPGAPPDLWRKYLTAVRQQALHLARQGRVILLRKGKVLDPFKPVKGVWRVALAESAEAGGEEEVQG